MNQIYRVIWSRTHGGWTVVAESARSSGKTHSGRLQKVGASIAERLQRMTEMNGAEIGRRLLPVAVMLAFMPMSAWAQTIAPNALPTGGTISAGQATISQSGSQMNIVQGSDKAALNWQSFNIGSGAGVTFQQPTSQSVALNRVAGADPSQIFGTLSANGKVILINPNGVVFGAGSRVDASGLIATTKALSDADFMSGNYRFTGGGNGVVRNDGTIIASPDGGVLLSADKVINTGTIQVRGGSIGMVAASDMQASADWRSATVVTAAASDINTITVENTGRLDVSGGTGGQINLQGGNGTTQSSGQLLAIGEQGKGGQIHLTGAQVGLMAGSLSDASGAAGGGEVLAGGDWQGSGSLQRASATYMDKDAAIKANATLQGDGGKVVLWADGYTNFRGQIQANGAGSGNGGMVETSGKDILDASGNVTAVGVQAGQWLLDPTDVSITSSGGGTLDGSGTYNPAGFGTISNTTINNALNAGTNVTISNTAGTGGSGFLVQNADAPISKTGGADATLNLQSAGNIQLNAGITSTSGRLNVNITADAGNVGTGAIAATTVTTNGGNINMSASSGIALNGVLTTSGGNVTLANNRSQLIDARSGATINAGTGNINITNTSPGGVSGVGWISLRDLIGGNITIANNIPDYVAGQNVLLLNGTTTASGTVLATTQTGNVWVNQNITSTAANNASAIILGAATPNAAGDSTGGNVTLVNGSKLIVSADSRAIIYTGSVADSTGVSSSDNGYPGAGRYRYNVVYGNTSRVPTTTGTYVQYREQPTLTMNLPDKVYDAVALNSQSWSSYNVTGWKNGDTAALNPLSGNLSLNGSTATVAKNVGNYAVALGTLADTLGYRLDVSGTPTYHITPAPLTVNGVATSKNYGHNDPALAYTASGFVGGETAATALTGNLGRNPGENVGSYNQTQGSLVATSGNYTITFTAAQLAITKDAAAPLSVIGNTVQKNYGANDPILTYTASGFVNGGVQSYNAAGTLQTVTIADNAGNSLTGNLGRNPGENVASYATTLGSLASGNYVINFTPGQLNIVKNTAAPLNVAGDSQQKTYATNDPTLTYSVTSGLVNGSVQSYNTAGTLQSVAINDTAASSLTGNLGRNPGENVGNYATTLGSLASANYAINFTAGQLAINKNTAAPLNVAGNTQQKNYGADDPTLTYNVTSGLVNGSVQSYNTAGNLQTVAINDTAASSLTGNLGRNSGENVGGYATTLGSLASANYAINFTAGQLNIVKDTASPLTVIGDTVQKSYGANDPALTYTASGFVNRGVQSYNPAGTLQTVNVNDTAAGSLTGNLGRNNGENVGGYATTLGSLASANYAIGFTAGQLNIVKDAGSPLTVASDAVQKTFGTNDPSLTYVVNGLFNRNVQSYNPAGNLQTVAINDTAAGSLSGNLGRNTGENVGAYATTLGSLASANYAISFTPASLTINPASVNVLANAQSKTYGQDDPDLNYTYNTTAQAQVQSYNASGTLGTVVVTGGGTPQFTGHLGRNTGETVGQYQIVQGSVAAPNYTINYTPDNLTITPANVSIVADAKTKVYGADDPALTYTSNNNSLVNRTVQSYNAAGTLQGTVIDDTVAGLQGSLGRQPGENVGSYAITKGSLGSPNYNVTFTSVNLDVTRAAVGVTADAQNKTYGQDDPTLTYTTTGLVNRNVQSHDAAGNVQSVAVNDTASSALTGNLGRQSGEAVGNRAITQGSLAASNYTIAFTPANLTIGTAPLTVTANAQSKGFGTNDPVLTYTSSGLVSRNAQVYNAAGTLQSVAVNDTATTALSGNLGRQSGENVGTYGITQGSLASSNYAIAFNPANLSITQAILSVVANAQTKIYGQDDPNLDYTYTTSAQANVQSYDAAGNLNTAAVTGGGTPQFVGHLGRNVGETVAQYQILQGSLAAPNYQINYTADNLNITPATVSIVADAKTKSFGTDDPTFTYTSNNNTLVNRTVQSYDTNGNVMFTPINDTVNGLQGNLGRVSGENVGQYQIVQGSLGSPNYLLTFTPVNLDITPAAMNVVANAQSKNYGQDDPDLTYTYNNSTQSQVYSRDENGNLNLVTVAGGGTPNFTGHLGRVSGENVGNYGILQGSLNAANYNISYTPAQLAINASTDPGSILNVVADGKTKVYGDSDPALTYQVANPSAFVNRAVRSYDANGNVITTTIADNASNALTGSLTRVPGEDVGAYGINQGSVAAQNYLISYSGSNLDITQRLLTISGLQVATRAYDTTTNAQISGGSLNGILAADAGNVNLDSTGGNFVDKNVGVGKDVLVNSAALSGSRAHNYAINYAQSTTTGTITPAELLLSGVTAQDKTYDGNTNATYQGSPTLTGVFASDAGKVNASVASLTGSFADRNAGTGKVVTPNVASAVLDGAEAGNYVVTRISPNVNTAAITPALLRVSGTSASKLFDGTTVSDVTPTVTGLVSGDSVANLFQQYNSMLPGKGKTLSVLNGFVVNDGNGGGNYVVQVESARGEIKGIPMGGDLAGLSSSGGSSSNNFVPASKNLDLLMAPTALEDIRQKAEQADYFLKANRTPLSSVTHLGE